MEQTADSSLSIIGSLSNNDGKGGENVTQKVNSRCFKLHLFFATFLICQILAIFSGVEFERSVSKFKKTEKENRCLVFTSAIKREIKNFHVVVVQ